jgi:ribonuclease P protein component
VSGDSGEPRHGPEASAVGPTPGRADQRLGRDRRLTRSSQFREAYAQGRRFPGSLMVLWLRAGDGAALRLGVVTGRGVGNAVQRARARRLLREAYRRHRHLFEGRVDVVLVARRRLLESKWENIVEDLLTQAGRAGLKRA